MPRQGFDLCKNRCIQHVAIGVPAIAAFTLASFFHLAHIGVDGLAGHGRPLGQFRIHSFAAGAIHQAGQQGFIVPGLAICLGFVSYSSISWAHSKRPQ